MRKESEMLRLILGVAGEDERIRAVLLSGSRADPAALVDKYSDYDIVYLTEDVTPFYNNVEWICEKFGKPAVMQLPELMSHPLLPPEGDGNFAYLMLFEDGNRIDLSICKIPFDTGGEPTVVLLDKDGAIGPLSIVPWAIRVPDEKLFRDTCNEFWWCLGNVAKGIARDQLPYVMEMFNHYVRDMLNQMVDWHIGTTHGFAVLPGKMGKYYKNHLSPELYALYAGTYSDADYGHIWAAIETACALFRTMAKTVSGHFGYAYNEEEDRFITAYLLRIATPLRTASLTHCTLPTRS